MARKTRSGKYAEYEEQILFYIYKSRNHAYPEPETSEPTISSSDIRDNCEELQNILTIEE